MNGILLIDKPKDWTSFDVVAKVRGILRATGVNKPKVGHTGTLDPQATGLLVLLLGDYTKKAPELTKFDKTYEVTMKLGETSSTGDSEGERTKISNKKPSKVELEAVLNTFTGELMQTPPAHSAIKIGGQRAYKLARQGKEVKLEPRPVTVYSIQLMAYSYPNVKFTAKVSSGTYIRSLVEDIGKELATGAYMSNLRRTKVGQFDLKDAVNAKDLSPARVYEALQLN